MPSPLLPSLDLDAATALALPLADVKVPAQFRFCFRLPDGDEEWLLARLCVVQRASRGERFNYCVVLRPENAETNRVFVAENLYYRAGQRALDEWMTPAQAKRWKWDLFEQSFNDNRYIRRLARFCQVKEEERNTLLKFGADGWGAICELPSQDDGVSESERFIWQRQKRGVSHEIADLHFLRSKDADFNRQIRELWENLDSPIQYAVFWSRLSKTEKDEIAFRCERGNWSQLREVATWVLTLFASRSQQSNGNWLWKFADYGYISVNKDFLKGEDERILLDWRAALTEGFGTRNVGAEGVKIDSLPLCLWSYISDDDRTFIEITPPSMHETMEAQLKLRDWAGAHFAPDEAARLLALLA